MFHLSVSSPGLNLDYLDFTHPAINFLYVLKFCTSSRVIAPPSCSSSLVLSSSECSLWSTLSAAERESATRTSAQAADRNERCRIVSAPTEEGFVVYFCLQIESFRTVSVQIKHHHRLRSSSHTVQVKHEPASSVIGLRNSGQTVQTHQQLVLQDHKISWIRLARVDLQQWLYTV